MVLKFCGNSDEGGDLFELVQVPAGNHRVTAMPEKREKASEYNIVERQKKLTKESTWCNVLIRKWKCNPPINEGDGE